MSGHAQPGWRRAQEKALAAERTASLFSVRWIGQQLGHAHRRNVTVLVCGSAEPGISDARDLGRPPIDFSSYRRIITNHGGRILELSRHGISACWGFPFSGEEDARRAARAALLIIEENSGGAPIACALQTGIAIADGQWSIELASSAFETAQRLLMAGGPASVVVSGDMRPLVERFFDLQPIQTADCVAWRIAGAEAAYSEAGRVTGALIGHVAERRQLDEVWLRVVDGQPQCVSISGEAGIGKSRLLRYLELKVKAAGGFWLECSCLPEGRRVPLLPLRQAMQRLLNADEAGLRQFIDGLEHSDRNLISFFLTHRAELLAGEHGMEHLPGERILTLILDWIAGLAGTGPVGLAFEDMHWADRSTCDFLAKGAGRIAKMGPVCLALTSRDPGVRGLRPTPHLPHTAIRLDKLSVAEIQQLLACNPCGSALPPEKRRQIALRSEGIPLFAMELARLCTGMRVGEDDLELLLRPGPLNAILSARLDSLRNLKPLAQAAAVIGREFDPGILALVLQMEQARLDASLDELVISGILEPTPGADTRRTLRFTHVLLRDAAYASVLEARRRELHGRIADVLTHDARVAEQEPEIIAGHFSAAGDPKGAFTWWYRAGVRAAELSSTRAAVHQLSQALAARRANPDAGSPREEVDILRLLGIQLAALKGNGAPEAVSTLERCLSLSRKVLGPEGDFDALWALHSCHLVRGEIGRALGMGDKLTACADRSGITERRLRAHRMQGLAKLLGGLIEEAFAHYRIVLDLYDEHRHAPLRLRHASDQGAVALAQLAWGEAIAGRLESSRRHADAALRLASRLQHPHTSAHVTCVLAARAQTLGEEQAASALAFAGRTLGERHEFPYWIAWADIILGWTGGGGRVTGGAAGTDIERIESAIAAYRRTGALQAVPYALLLVADKALACDRPQRALKAAMEGWQIAWQQGLMLYASELLRVRALAEKKLGSDPAHIANLVDRAVHLAASQGAETFSSRAAGFRIHPAPQCLDMVLEAPKI